MSDEVNSPPHYNQGDIECIDAIRAGLGPEGFAAYCRGNVWKYTWRYLYKGGAKDLEKAGWYLNRLIETVENLSTSDESPTFHLHETWANEPHGGEHWSTAKDDRVNCGYVDCKRCVYLGLR